MQFSQDLADQQSIGSSSYSVKNYSENPYLFQKYKKQSADQKVVLAFALRVWENPGGENRTRSDRSLTKYKDFVGFVPVLFATLMPLAGWLHRCLNSFHDLLSSMTS